MESVWNSLRSCCQGRRKVSKLDHAENQRQTANLIKVNSQDSDGSTIQNINQLHGNGRQITALLDNAVAVSSSVSSDTYINSSSSNSVNRTPDASKNHASAAFTRLMACFPKRTKSDKNKSKKYKASDREVFLQGQNKPRPNVMGNQPPCTEQTDVTGTETCGFNSVVQIDSSALPQQHDSVANDSKTKNTCIPSKGVIAAQRLCATSLDAKVDRESCCTVDGAVFDLFQDKDHGDISDVESYYSCGSTGSVISLCNHAEIEPGHQVISHCQHKHPSEMNAGNLGKGAREATIVEGEVLAANGRKRESKPEDDCLQDDVFVPDPKDRNGNNFASLNWRNAKQPSFGELERDFGAFVQKTKLKKQNNFRTTK